jgi:hypothetical protein
MASGSDNNQLLQGLIAAALVALVVCVAADVI